MDKTERWLSPQARVGLCLAHPGHELRLTRWIGQQRPTVFVLTSGSRSGDNRIRVTASRTLLASLGARAGGLFGERLDRGLYAMIMAGDAQPFVQLAHELAEHIVVERLDAVITDGWQLYDVAHDLWHLVTRAAVACASERLGRRVACFDYPVVPFTVALRAPGEAQHVLMLTEAELQHKLDLAAAFPDMAEDVAAVLAAGGPTFVGTESFHRLRPMSELLPRPGETPAYERDGELRVQAGLYHAVLRWEHVAPIAAELVGMLGDWDAAA